MKALVERSKASHKVVQRKPSSGITVGGAVATSEGSFDSAISGLESCACGGGCPRCNGIQTKLQVSMPRDQQEVEADQVADQIMRLPNSMAGLNANTGIMCRRAVAEPMTGQPIAPVLSDLDSGYPLPDTVRSYFEPRFGQDFGHVRVHIGEAADGMTQNAQARAFTSGSHIAFARDSWQPGSFTGRQLIAHELVHVVQNQAEPSSAAMLKRSFRCQGILDASIPQSVGGGSSPIRGVDAHRRITMEYILDNGPFRRLNIPAASSSPYRTEGCSSDVTPSAISPLAYSPGPRSRAGIGIPDLLFWSSNGVVEIGEIKPATHGCLVFAEQQVQNYVDKGNAPYNRGYRRRRRPPIRSFRTMSMNRWTSLPLRMVEGGLHLLVDWCSPGVIGYLGVRDTDPNIFVCSSLSDQGRVDDFLDNAIGRARTMIDRMINRRLNRMLHDAIERLSVRELVRLIFGNSVASSLPPDFGTSPVEQIIEARLRRELHRVKDRFITRLQQQLQNNIRQFLQYSLTALCAGALAVSLNQLLDRLRQNLERFIVQAAAQVVTVMLAEAMEQISQAIDKFLEEYGMALLGILLAIVAVVAIAFLVLDDATGIGAADDPLLVPAGALLARAIAMMRPLLQLFRWTPIRGPMIPIFG